MTGLLLVCDLDGTLTFDGRRPQPAVLEALHACERTDGLQLVLATARSPRCLRRWFGPLASRIDLVCCNGALHIDPSGLRTRHPIDPAAVERIVPRLDAAGVAWCAEYGDHFVASSRNALPWMGHRDRRVRQRAHLPRPAGVLKLCVDRSDPGQAVAGDIPGITFLPHATGDGDLVAAGVDKSIPVAALRGTATMVALGNDLNDARLLTSADQSYVVGDNQLHLDAHPHVRRIAADPRAVATTIQGILGAIAPARRGTPIGFVPEPILPRQQLPAPSV